MHSRAYKTIQDMCIRTYKLGHELHAMLKFLRVVQGR